MNEHESISEVIQISCGYNIFETEMVVKENSVQFEYIGFCIDREQNKLLVLSRENEAQLNANLYLKITNLDDFNDIYVECEIVDPEMRGIFLSGQYKLVD